MSQCLAEIDATIQVLIRDPICGVLRQFFGQISPVEVIRRLQPSRSFGSTGESFALPGNLLVG
jgi:hypothetical protein